jgi:molecular chaperone DnaK
MALQRLKEAAERAKKDLSQQTTADINLPFITADASGPKHLQLSITRSKFEQMVEHLIERCRRPVMQALQDAGYKPNQIDEIVLVGGMTRMPRVQQIVKDIFGKEGHKGVNPDEVVAVGAAIQGAQLLLGSKSDLLLLDVTPLTLGIETLGGVMTPMIQRNTTIPKKATEKFTTAADSQPSVEVKVYQGERPMARDNKLIGTFHLDGIPPAPRGVPQIEVTFDIDANGVLNVSAKDLGTSKENKIRIEGSSGMSPDEIERMRKDAESHADDDKRKRELIDERNKADSLIYNLEKSLKDAGDKIKESDRAPIQAAIEKVKQAASGEDVAAIKRAVGDLEQAAQAMAQVLYSQPGQQGPTPSGAAPESGGDAKKGKDDVIDAEFEVKK